MTKEEINKPDYELNLSSNTCYIITINDINLLFQQDLTMKVMEMPKIYFLPFSPKWCSGLVNIHGNLLPLINLHSFLSDKIKDHSFKYILTLHSKEYSKLALLIQNLPRPIQIKRCRKMKNTIEKTLNKKLFPYISNIYQTEKKEQLFDFNYHHFMKSLIEKAI